MVTARHSIELWLPKLPAEIFPFFANARNLEAITPPWLHFRVLEPNSIIMKTGALIDYRLRLHGIPFRWQSEITLWDPPFRFVDEQRRGPYLKWTHLHTFEEKSGGTLCGDHVDYAAPGGWIIDRLFVRKEIRRIFQYRQEAMKERFETAKGSS